MTFLYAVHAHLSVGGQSGLNELSKIYNYACHPDIPYDANDPNDTRMVLCGANGVDGKRGRPIGWIDAEQPIPASATITVEHGGFLSGAQRKWGENDLLQRPQNIELIGNVHGVSENITP